MAYIVKHDLKIRLNDGLFDALNEESVMRHMSKNAIICELPEQHFDIVSKQKANRREPITKQFLLSQFRGIAELYFEFFDVINALDDQDSREELLSVSRKIFSETGRLGRTIDQVK